MLFGGDTQFRWGAERIFPQCVWIGSGVQLLQSVHGGRRDVLGRRDPGDIANQSSQTATDTKFPRVRTKHTYKNEKKKWTSSH